MRRLVSTLFALATLAAPLAAQTHTDFSGKWVLDPKSVENGMGPTSMTLTVKQDAKTITIESAATSAMGDQKSTIVYNVDGSESKNTVGGAGGSVDVDVDGQVGRRGLSPRHQGRIPGQRDDAVRAMVARRGRKDASSAAGRFDDGTDVLAEAAVQQAVAVGPRGAPTRRFVRAGAAATVAATVWATLAACTNTPRVATAPYNGAFDVVITNGKIVDGTGNAWYYGDVGIVGDRIARIAQPGALERSAGETAHRCARPRRRAGRHRHPGAVVCAAAHRRQPSHQHEHAGRHDDDPRRRRHVRARERRRDGLGRRAGDRYVAAPADGRTGAARTASTRGSATWSATAWR